MMQAARLFRLHSVPNPLKTSLKSITICAPLSASHFQRPQLVGRADQEKISELRMNVFKNRNELKPEEWHATRQMLIDTYKNITEDNIDAAILGMCNDADQLPLAKNYVQYLRDNGVEPNLASLGRLLRSYNAAYHARGGTEQALTSEEQTEVLEIYAHLRQKYDVLDATTCENVIHGLVATTEWHDSKELLEISKLSGTPSAQVYTELGRKAFAAGDFTLGWQLVEEMLTFRKQPKCELYRTYLHTISKQSETFPEQFEKMLRFLQLHGLVITDNVVDYMEKLAVSLPTAFSISRTQLSRFGKCSRCENSLQNVCISDAEFDALSNSFLNKVLIRRDVFQKSTPEEVEKFKHFVKQTAPYDCVIDGLNVAYSTGPKKPPHILAKLLAAVVQHFQQHNKHVLVLGRKHMNSWPKNIMQFVRQNATVFLTKDLTHDDPFLLYATLKSGPSTDFFSRDLMRSHAYLLGPELKPIFRRWQQEHQYSLVTQTDCGKIIVKEPTRYVLNAHKVSGYWHLPYKSEYSANPPDSYEQPEKWLCIKIHTNLKKFIKKK